MGFSDPLDSPTDRRAAATARWKWVADWAKQRPAVLRLADRLGRSRGRLSFFNGWTPLTPAPQRIRLDGWADEELSVAWIGHATLLIRIAGRTVLTDPVFSQRVGLGGGFFTMGPRRRYAPAISIDRLPPIDLILLSHAHFDHLDRPSLARLPRSADVVVASGCADLVSDLRFRSVRELPVEQAIDFGPLRVTAWPVVHWGARTFDDHHRGFNAFLLEDLRTPTRTILFGGDSAYHEFWKGRQGVDAAILGIGGYLPHIQGHATPEQALDMARQVRAKVMLPIHHSTFGLSHEPWDEPMRRLMVAASKEAAPAIGIRQVGDRWSLRT